MLIEVLQHERAPIKNTNENNWKYGFLDGNTTSGV